ncbi:MAG: hypothetical protein QGH83_15910 [Candidatus Pacebacteria bacterium]|jgi:hypothetical protein|nr:hypothetical protein [Candidatus Paceibacterota bacterium]
MLRYRIVSTSSWSDWERKILSEGLTAEDASVALEIYKDVNGESHLAIEEYNDAPHRLGRDPDFH